MCTELHVMAAIFTYTSHSLDTTSRLQCLPKVYAMLNVKKEDSAGSVCCFLEQETFTPQKYW